MKFSQKDIENWQSWKMTFFLSRPFWILFFQKKIFFASSLWKLVKNYVIEWKGLNFYDYDGIQPKLSPPKTFQPAVYIVHMEELCLNRPTVWHASFARCLMWDDNEPRPSTTAGTVNKNLWKFLHDFTNRHWHFLLVFRHVVFTYLLSIYKLRQFETANRAETKQLQGITKKNIKVNLILI